MLSDIRADKPRASRRGRAPRWPWLVLTLLVLLVAVLWLGFGGAWRGDGGSPLPALAASGHDLAVQRSVAADGSGGEVLAGTRTTGGAVILPDQAAAAVTTQSVPAAPATGGRDTAALSQMFNPAAERKPITTRRRSARAAGSRHDADVALLTDLLTHVEAGTPAERHALDRIQGIKPVDPIQAKMMKCPAPNTAKGLQCRQRVCAGHAGESPACPKGASDASASVEPAPEEENAAAPMLVHQSRTREPMPPPAAPAAVAAARAVPAAGRRVVARVAPPAAAAPASGTTRGVSVLQLAAAKYPVAAARDQASGYVMVEFTVTADGAVSGPHVVSASPRQVFDKAAIDAIQHSKFAPAMRDGQPVATVVRRRIDFKYSDN